MQGLGGLHGGLTQEAAEASKPGSDKGQVEGCDRLAEPALPTAGSLGGRALSWVCLLPTPCPRLGLAGCISFFSTVVLSRLGLLDLDKLVSQSMVCPVEHHRETRQLGWTLVPSARSHSRR